MESDVFTNVLLPARTPTPAVLGLAAAGILVWLGIHFLRRRAESRWARALFLVFRVAIASGSFWLLLNVALRLGLSFDTSRPLWVFGFVGGGCIEIIITLYRLERSIVSTAVGVVLLALRLLAVVLIVAILIQPVIVSETTHTEERFVVVLVDVSASMDFTDEHASVSEMLALAEVFLPVPPKRPFRVDRASVKLRAISRELGEQIGWLKVVEDSQQKKSDGAAKPWQKRMTIAADAAAGISRKLAKDAAEFVKLSKPQANVVATLKIVESKLTKDVAGPARKAAALCAALNDKNFVPQCAEIKALLTGATKALDEVIARLDVLGPAVDEAVFASLSDEQRKAIGEVAAKQRSAIASHLLNKGRGDKPGILVVLGQKYSVRIYGFASAASEMIAATNDGKKAPATAEAIEARQTTDVVAAVEKAMADVASGKLAGVLLITDGRHNASVSIETVGSRLAEHGVPACSIMIGSTKSPSDASVVGITVPSTTQVKDKLAVKAEIRVEGMKGKAAEVVLILAGKEIDRKSVPVPGDSFRTTVELTDHPKEAGLRAYEVRIRPIEGERVDDNNAQLAHVDVTDDPTKLLLIEGRPRWEFRYLRNLFADRDRSVKLQHVLLRPDWIDGAAARQIVHASADRGLKDVEASALPNGESEWLKFDTIIIGDVPPAMFGKEELAILEKFVSERPRRLIVIAGSNYMPHAYAGTSLDNMLPVAFVGSTKTIPAGPEVSFHITLTEEGKRHDATKLDENPAANEEIWESLPEIYWRHPIKTAKPGAKVLAFAMPTDVPPIFQADVTHAGGKAGLARERALFERTHAVITTAHYALGRVMLIGFDSTWRFRYRKGDTHHHKFWGQVIRWATADKLSAGNEFVRLGTGSRIYEPEDNVLVRASLHNKKHEPVASDGVSVAVYRGEVLETRTKLKQTADTSGFYEGDLGKLPAGHKYRVVLEVKDPKHKDVEASARNIETEVVVSPAGRAEASELSADRTMLDVLAQDSGGKVAGPADAADVLDRFGAGTHEVTTPKTQELWYHWILFIVLAFLVSAEWIMRKKVGLT